MDLMKEERPKRIKNCAFRKRKRAECLWVAFTALRGEKPYHWVSSRYKFLYCLAEFSQETSLAMSR